MSEGSVLEYKPEGSPPNTLTLEEATNRLWSKTGGLAVNLGSGNAPISGYVNVDIRPDATNVDVVCDLYNDEWPFPDNSVGLVYSSHFLEHVPSDRWAHVWNEAWRVMLDGGHVVSLTPFCWSNRQKQDHTHVQDIHPDKWCYLGKEWRTINNVHHDGFVPDMDFVMDIDPWFIWNEDFKHASTERQRFALNHYINVVDDIVIFTCAVKSKTTADLLLERFGTTL